MARLGARIGRAFKRVFVTLALIFFVALILILWAFQTGRAVEIAREKIIFTLRDACGVDASFDALRLGIFPPEAHMTKLVITSSGGASLLAVDEAIVELEVFPLFYGRVQLDKVALLAPRATINLVAGRITNLPRCLEPSAVPDEPQAGPSAPIALGVSDLRIERAQFRLLMPPTLDADLEAIDVTLEPGDSGGSDLAVGIDRGTITVGEKILPLKKARLLAHVAGPLVAPRALAVEHVALEVSELLVSGSGAVDLIGPVYEAQILATAPLDVAKKVIDGLPSMGGTFELRAQVFGTAIEPRAVGRLVVKNGAIDVYRTGDEVSIDFRADRRRADLPSLEVKVGEGLVSGSATIDLEGPMRFEADIDCDEISLGRVLEAAGVAHAWVDYRGTGKVTAKGQVSPFDLGGKVDIEVRDLFVYDQGFDRPEATVFLSPDATHVRGVWDADADGFWIRDALITRGTTTGTATARINFADKDGIYLTARFDPFDLAEVGPIAGVPFTGRGRLEAVIKGPYWDVGATGRFTLDGTSIGGVPFGTAASDVTWSGTSIEFEGIEGKLVSSPYRGTARLDFAPKLILHLAGSVLEGGRFEDLLVPFNAAPADWGSPTGTMTGTFDLTGPVTELTGPVEMSLGDISIVGEKAARGRISGRLERGAVVFEAVEVEKYGARLFGSGRIDPRSGAIKGRLHTQGLTLQRLDVIKASTDRLDARLDIEGEVSGNIKGASGTITAAVSGGKAGDLALGGGKINGKIRGASVELSGALLDGALGVEGVVDLKSGLPYRGTLRLEDYDAGRLLGAMWSKPSWTGRSQFRAELSGGLINWRDSAGAIFLDRAAFDGEGIRLELIGAAKVTLDRGVLETKRLVLGGPDTRLQVIGKLGSDLADLKIQGRTDLGLLEKIYPNIERSGGVLTVNAVVRRNKQDLDLVGTGRVDRGMLQWRGLPSRFSSVGANLTFSQATVLIDRAEGRYAEGRITANGQVLLEGMRPSTIAIEAVLEDVRPEFVYSKFDLTGTFGGKLFLEGKPERLMLRGELKAERTTFRPKFDWRAIVADPAQRLTPSVYDPSKEILHFDIGMKFDPEDPLRLRNDTAQVDLSGETTLTGTNQRLGLLGSLTVSRGRVGFIGREYAVESGTMDFRERYRFFPHFDLLLSARACDATMSLNLVGTLDAVSTSYSSKPEMEETNIVSCLIRGVKIKDLENIRGDRGSTAASFAGEALWRLSGVDQQVRKVLPVDQIEVTTEYSTRERVYEPRILVAKELQDGKFRLEYSSSLVKNDDQRAAVRYRITPQLTLQYGWTSSEDVTIGDHGLDLKYRWEW